MAEDANTERGRTAAEGPFAEIEDLEEGKRAEGEGSATAGGGPGRNMAGAGGDGKELRETQEAQGEEEKERKHKAARAGEGPVSDCAEKRLRKPPQKPTGTVYKSAGTGSGALPLALQSMVRRTDAEGERSRKRRDSPDFAAETFEQKLARYFFSKETTPAAHGVSSPSVATGDGTSGGVSGGDARGGEEPKTPAADTVPSLEDIFVSLSARGDRGRLLRAEVYERLLRAKVLAGKENVKDLEARLRALGTAAAKVPLCGHRRRESGAMSCCPTVKEPRSPTKKWRWKGRWRRTVCRLTTRHLKASQETLARAPRRRPQQR